MMRKDLKSRYCRFSREKSQKAGKAPKVQKSPSTVDRKLKSGGTGHIHSRDCVSPPKSLAVEVGVGDKHCQENSLCGGMGMGVGKGGKSPCSEVTVCSICTIRSLQRPRSVELECKHFLCDVCYSKVFSCPFCRCPLYGCIGKRLKRATKMFLCLLKQFKRQSCVKASSVMLLLELLEKTKEKAKKLDPEKEGVKKIKSRIHTLSGTVHFKLLGELDAASAEYKQALALFPANLEAMNLYAGLLSRRGQESVLLAIDLMNKALKLDQENPILLCNLSKYYGQLGNIDASISLLKQAGKLQGSNEAVQRYIWCIRQFLNAQVLAKQAMHAAQPQGLEPGPCAPAMTPVRAVTSLHTQALCKE